VEPLINNLKAALPGLMPADISGTGCCPIQDPDPHGFFARLLPCLDSGRPVLLLDSAWPESWTTQMLAMVQENPPGDGELILATSGSTGIPKLCRHSLSTLHVAARGCVNRFGEGPVRHAVIVLPCHHIGGLMPLFRAAAASATVHFADYRSPASIASAPFPIEEASISLVPTQLTRMLGDPATTSLLARFGMILIGGAAAPSALLEKARQHRLRIALCYGSTETAAMVTALEPEAFLDGQSNVGSPLPHARISIGPDQQILIESDSLTLGYLPANPSLQRNPFQTGDLGFLDEAGALHVLGRKDRAFITGGEKVHPGQVEAAALATGLVTDAVCTGVPDPLWGTRIELRVTLREPHSAETLRRAMAQSLPPYALPKRIVARGGA